MSYFFYEQQRAGPLPASTRAPWRGDTLKAEGTGNLDGVYQGGYFDAGDHNKFQLPTAYATARLAWLVHAFKDSLELTSFDVRAASLSDPRPEVGCSSACILARRTLCDSSTCGLFTSPWIWRFWHASQ